MRSSVAAGVAAVALGLYGCGGSDGGGARQPEKFNPDPTGVAPAALLDLSHWQLTLPVNENGGRSGLAATVSTQRLLDGYDSQWFYGSDGDGVTFWAPADGATTANAPYARSELREMLDPDDASVNWRWTDFAELTALVRVNQVPAANGEVTVGQILGYSGEDPAISELAKLIFEYNSAPQTARLYAQFFPTPSAPASTAQILTLRQNLTLNEAFTYVLRVQNERLTVGSDGVTATVDIDPSWAGVGLYFRAGAALNAIGLAGDGGRVTFFDLKVRH